VARPSFETLEIGETEMKIKEVEVICLRIPEVKFVSDGTQDAALVKITADNGLTGWGEVNGPPEVVRIIVEAPMSNSISRGLRDILFGKDPADIEVLWNEMYRGTIYFGRRGLILDAISGVEMALWDLLGKSLKQPVHKLLGGAYRKQVRVYASTLFPEDPGELERVKNDALKYKELGYKAVKFGWGGFGKAADSDLALIETARENLGPNIDLLIDVGLCWDLQTTLSRIRLFDRYNLFWLEAPLMPDEVESYAILCDKSPIRIATEEDNFWDAKRLLQEGRLHVILPDASNVGGLLQWKKISKLAQSLGSWCVPHAFSTGIIKAASLHLVANQEFGNLAEYSVSDSPLNSALTTPAFQFADGYVKVPETPGLGVNIDEGIVAKYRVP
jgi:L-rhamnonate dehydratase